MAKEQIAAAELILGLIQGKTEGVSRVEYMPQKGRFPEQEPYEQPFLRSTPERQGVPSRLLAGLIRNLAQDRQTDIHHLMVLRHGYVICECDFAPYRGGIWHITHSMCKSITGMAIGLLVEEGRLSLDENVYKIFEKKVNPLAKRFRPELKVRHLLTMTSGVTFNETGAVSGNDWLSGFLNSPVSGKQGAAFQYNSMNSYVLSAIVTERTGLPMAEYLTPRLFAPMGITKFFWETCPRGITKGGWGLFLCPEDMAKLGMLYLRKGVWKGRRLIPERWVEESVQKQTDSVEGTFGYGYQIWREERTDSFEFNGMLGQNVVVYPDLDMVLVTNAGSNELFQNCVLLDTVRKSFPPQLTFPDRLSEDPCAYLMLKDLCAAMQSGAWQEGGRLAAGGWGRAAYRTGRRESRLSGGAVRRRERGCAGKHAEWLRRFADGGRAWELEQKSVGLFPLALQVFHNNLSSGIRRLRLYSKREALYLEVQEGADTVCLPVGLGKAEECWITLHGESYLAGVRGTFGRDEDKTAVLTVDIAYLEEAVRRKIKIFFREGEKIEVKWTETPGKTLIMEGLISIMAELEHNFLFSAFREIGGADLLRLLMERTIEPVTVGHPVPDGGEPMDEAAVSERRGPETDAGAAKGEEKSAEARKIEKKAAEGAGRNRRKEK